MRKMLTVVIENPKNETNMDTVMDSNYNYIITFYLLYSLSKKIISKIPNSYLS